MTPQEILENAARLIEHGPLPWGKGSEPGGRIAEDHTCIVKAVYGNGTLTQVVPQSVWEALERVCNIPYGILPQWNDAPERTKEEVILALYDAKRFLP